MTCRFCGAETCADERSCVERQEHSGAEYVWTLRGSPPVATGRPNWTRPDMPALVRERVDADCAAADPPSGGLRELMRMTAERRRRERMEDDANTEIRVYDVLGNRLFGHHCDGHYSSAKLLGQAVTEAILDNEVAEVRCVKQSEASRG